MLNLNRELNPVLLQKSLRCPVCSAGLSVSADEKSLICTGEKQHCFDAGAGGYVSLCPRHPGGGDEKSAVTARSRFLRAGYYRPAAEAICTIVKESVHSGALLLDAGCGEGYYSNLLAQSGFRVMGVDLSRFAVDAAAKASRAERIGCVEESPTLYAVGSVFDLPVRDGSFDLITNIFAPCAAGEYARAVKKGGFLIVAGAGERHLIGLKKLIYDEVYINEGRRDLPGQNDGWNLSEKRKVSFEIKVSGHEDVEALFSMTPYYWRTSMENKARLDGVETLDTEVDFDIFLYRKKD